MQIREVRPESFVAQMRCGAEARHDEGEGFSNFVSIGFDASWGSAIGDGTRVDVDLCHGCFQTVLGPWLRLSASSWNRLPSDDPAPEEG